MRKERKRSPREATEKRRAEEPRRSLIGRRPLIGYPDGLAALLFVSLHSLSHTTYNRS